MTQSLLPTGGSVILTRVSGCFDFLDTLHLIHGAHIDHETIFYIAI